MPSQVALLVSPGACRAGRGRSYSLASMRRALAACLLALALALSLSRTARADCDSSREDVIVSIYYASSVYHVPADRLLAVAEAETGTNHCRNGQVTPGDGGLSVGAFQLHRFGAWNDPANPYLPLGLAGRYDLGANVMFSAWHFATYGQMCAWPTYVRLYGCPPPGVRHIPVPPPPDLHPLPVAVEPDASRDQ